MVNIYSELKLDPSASLPELQSELIRQEQLWHRREINSPETATARLALINEAKKIFASPSTKAAYDRMLEDSRRKPAAADPNAERRTQWKKWYDSALRHMEEGHYDLAKTSIERALSYFDIESVDSQFYNIVATIFRENQDYYGSLSYINRAIVVDPENPSLYLTKAITLTAYLESKEQIRDRTATVKSEVDAYMLAIQKSDAINDTDTLAIADSMFAYSLIRATRQIPMSEYIKKRTIDNENSARKYAELAVKLGDPWSIGKSVLDTLTQIENEYIRMQDEQKHAFAAKYRAKKQQDDFIKWQKEQEESYYQTINSFKQETGITEIYTPVALNPVERTALQDAVSLIEEDKWLKPYVKISSDDILFTGGRKAPFDYEIYLYYRMVRNYYKVILHNSYNPVNAFCKISDRIVPRPRKTITQERIDIEKALTVDAYKQILNRIRPYFADSPEYMISSFMFYSEGITKGVQILITKENELYMNYAINHSKSDSRWCTEELGYFHNNYMSILMGLVSQINEDDKDQNAFSGSFNLPDEEKIKKINVRIWKDNDRCLNCGGGFVKAFGKYRCMRCFEAKSY